jgi:flagellar biosynthesis component FlhA
MFLSFFTVLIKNWKLFAFIILSVLLFSSGWWWRDSLCDQAIKEKEIEQMLEAESIRAEEQEKADQIGEKLEETLAKQKKTIYYLNKRLQNEINQNTAYDTCRVTDTGVRALQEAVSCRDNPSTCKQPSEMQ